MDMSTVAIPTARIVELVRSVRVSAEETGRDSGRRGDRAHAQLDAYTHALCVLLGSDNVARIAIGHHLWNQAWVESDATVAAYIIRLGAAS